MTEKKSLEQQASTANEDQLASANTHEKASDNQPALDNEWLTLAEDWQSQPYDKVDVNKLLKQTQRRTLWAKMLLFIDVLSTLFIIVFFIYGLYKGEWKTATLFYLGSASIAFVFYTAYAVKVRVKSWRLMAGDPNKIVESALIGCRSSLQYIKLIKWTSIPLFIWLNSYLYIIEPEVEKSVWPALIMSNGIIIVMTIVCHFMQRQRERELKQLESFLSE
ncbi:hypothetical protein AAD001_02760 [Colwelliaceae bacterium 6471]